MSEEEKSEQESEEENSEDNAEVKSEDTDDGVSTEKSMVDEAKEAAEKRVNGLRDDIKDLSLEIRSNSTRLTAVETRCNIEHGEL